MKPAVAAALPSTPMYTYSITVYLHLDGFRLRRRCVAVKRDIVPLSPIIIPLCVSASSQGALL